jgi:predicted small integral membrane protein
MTWLEVVFVILCAIVVWEIRRPLFEMADPVTVAWTSPVDDSYFEALLPASWDAMEVWDVLAWIGSLPEVARVG